MSGSVVQWNGSSRTTTFVSASQLTATTTANDIAASGSTPVTVNNPSPGGGTSNSMAITIGNAAPTVSGLVPATVTAAGSNFAGGCSANAVLAQEFDGRFVSFAQRIFRSGGLPEIFAIVHDTCRGAPAGCVPGAVRISEASDGTWPDGLSGSASLEANGAAGAFASDATNLVPGDTNAKRGIFRALTGFTLR
jgi:hypothetical protein